MLCVSLTQKSKLRHILCLLSSCLSPQNNNNIKSGLMQQTACDASAIYTTQYLKCKYIYDDD